jgi:hypothetical protein
LFTGPQRRALRLVDTTTLGGSGVVILRYRPA